MSQSFIPPQLEETLNEDRALAGLVNTAISEFGVWLERNDVKFFAEYTDHSLQHVRDVLAAADELIRLECRDMMKSADVAVLVLSALLHDCAMHISIDGFINLVQSNNQPIIEGFHDKPWNTLWLDFLAESRRYSGRKLMALFGDTEPVRHPPMNSQEMNGKDLLLCGEFLRKHHHRLAHEIALFGVPGYSEDKLKIPTTEDTQHIVDLAGVIARSHGLAIRDCFDYLKLRYSSVKLVRSVHPVYMMALLRIADILQIQQKRAPKQIQKVVLLKSPVSLAEWEMHQAIKDVHLNDEIPETLFVVAEPKNVGTYLKIRKLLDQIQNELDKSWTVIGEVYSYDPKFREFGLTIRRVRSNLDDVTEFSKGVKYLPIHASFDVADTDLLKLLIAPLYGDDPAIGIRELMQNAIDAVREREEYQRQRPELQNIDLPDHEGDVLISIDQEKDGKWWITVSDKGMGMTPDTLKEYFLKAGASLRRSEIWKKTFENEEGESTVLRSGRFGIGALATFLLGDEIYVSTRHISDKSGEGIQFQSHLDTAAIEFQKIKRPIGTIIRVQISTEIKNRLEENKEGWNWYYLDKPTVVRTITGEILPNNQYLPNMNKQLPDSWRRIQYSGYQDIQWAYPSKDSKYDLGVFVNGIFVKYHAFQDALNSIDFLGRNNIEFALPALSIFDFSANFPLNLQRTNITSSEYPFINELGNDVLKDFLAFVLVHGPTQSISDINAYVWYFRDRYVGNLSEYTYGYLGSRKQESLWCSTNDGFCLNLYWSLKNLAVKTALVVTLYTNSNYEKPIEQYIPIINVKFPQILSGLSINDLETLTVNDKVSKFNDVLAKLVEPYTEGKIEYIKYIGREGGFYTLGIHHLLFYPGVRLLMCRSLVQLLKDAQEHSIYSGFEPFWKVLEININHLEEWGNNDWVLWKIGECKETGFDFVTFAKENPNPNLDDWPCILAERYFLDETPKFKDLAEKDENLRNHLTEFFEISPLEEVWMELLSSPIIPFDLNERREKFPRAYKELKPYIEAHEATKAKNEARKVEDQDNIIE